MSENTSEELAARRIEEAANASELDLSGLGLKTIPAEVFKMTQLKALILSNNEISTLPPEIGQLTNLLALFLANNGLSSLPNEIRLLSKLKFLYLGGNKFKMFPRQLLYLTCLNMLSLSGNNLAYLPEEIVRLKDLAGMDLSDNNIERLPGEILQLQDLQELNVRNNPLISVPPEILARTEEPSVILSYYFDHVKKPLNESKILVVGQGSVGKTSIIRRLLQNSFSPEENKTEGINISRVKIRMDSNLFTLNIWDFGGQEIMHATHQFFLTKRSLYLLVLDARLTQEENRVEYWLKIIQSFGGESPVLIVGNKADQHPLDIDHTGLQKKYPNIVGVLETSAAIGTGITGLRSEIANQVSKLPHVHDLLPEVWFKVKSHLEGLGREKNYISHEEYIKLCVENDVTDETNQHTLIGFLHDLGVVLHFQDDARLEALGILNPQWVTNGVYKILNSHTLFDNKGVLERTMLDEILKFPEYPANKRLFIVDMMRKFELCYDIDRDRFLIPDLLPKSEPFVGERDWGTALAFQYHYNVLPSSIISRFIVRMNTYIHRTIWRSGVVLKKAGNTALVKADTEDKKIFIWVSGDEPTRRDFLAAIRAEFESIHKTIIKIEAREKVPVPSHPEVVVDYEHLLNLERLGERSFIPEGLRERVNVRALLNGVTTESDRTSQPEPSSDPNASASKTAPSPGLLTSIPMTKKSLLIRILFAIFVTLPRVTGRTILEIFGREKTSDITHLVVGYLLFAGTILLLMGILDGSAIFTWLMDTLRFLFSK